MTPRGARRSSGGIAFLLGIALGALLLPAPIRAQDANGLQPIPEPVGYVNDHADVLDESTEARLEAFLDQVERKTGAEFAILTVPTTAPETPDQYKVRVFERWGIGKRGEDNGLLMLLAREERELRFETGYGLEGTLPDGLQSRIFRREMAPRFREDDFAGGITAGVLACATRIAAEKGVTLEWDGRELRYRRGGEASPLVALAIFLAIAVAITIFSRRGPRGRRRRRRFGSGWDAGGWGGWGGGFGGGLGGGWRGGGGGSFGGFGGGASGGGGGGGKW